MSRSSFPSAALTVAGLLASRTGHSEGVMQDELLTCRHWVAAAFGADASRPPFEFTYGGRAFSTLTPRWPVQRATRPLDDARVEHTLTCTDPSSGLEVRCVAVEYRDYPVVEWVLYLRNTGTQDTPLVENVLPLDVRLERGPDAEFALHVTRGGIATRADYEPLSVTLPPGQTQAFSPNGGRSCDPVLPYFSVEAPMGEGVIVAVGWPGQWCAEFARDEGAGLRVTAGQQQTRFVLHPGEEIRTPLVALQFWRGERVHAQNVWRRWMLAHNVPRPGGKLPAPMLSGTSGWVTGWGGQTEANQNELIDGYLRQGLDLDYWWIDAGWYDMRGAEWETSVGTWEADSRRFPRGLKGVADHAHQRGAGFITWFEPERICPGSRLYEEHPEWLLSAPGRADKLLNLGDPSAREWLTEHVGGMIAATGMDVYRQDFNVEPLAYWRANDPEDRQGITEIRYLEGHLAYWDALRRRHPNLLIDSCASGGRRNDLETLRRAVPLQRSDYTCVDPVSQQCQTYGIASWIPFYGDGMAATTEYELWSVLAPSVFACYDTRADDPALQLVARVVREWRTVAPCYLGDYYPLTPYDLGDDSLIAWQFDRPDLGEGMLQAFARSAAVASVSLQLRGLRPTTQYVCSLLDGTELARAVGRDLMDRGLTVPLRPGPSVAVVRYRVIDY